MPPFIHTAGGTQYPESAIAPGACVICEAERHVAPQRGRSWTTCPRR